jgi:predicted nucleic acid-binding protein
VEFKYVLPDWIIIQEVKDKEKFFALEKEPDPGEASAIALSYEVTEAVLVLDDLGARKVASRLKINFTGTFGVIVKAKQYGIISSVHPILNKVRSTNFRFSDQVYIQTLKEAGEL